MPAVVDAAGLPQYTYYLRVLWRRRHHHPSLPRQWFTLAGEDPLRPLESPPGRLLPSFRLRRYGHSRLTGIRGTPNDVDLPRLRPFRTRPRSSTRS